MSDRSGIAPGWTISDRDVMRLRLAQARWALSGYEHFAKVQRERADRALVLVEDCRAEIAATEAQLARAGG